MTPEGPSPRTPGLAGILPPITTPFDEAGELDLGALEVNLERYRGTGLEGLVVFGSNGEAVHLDGTERATMLHRVQSQAGSWATLVAGINELSTRAAKRAIEDAAEAEFDYALVITPYFYKGGMSQAVLRDFYLDLAEGSPLPLLLYTVPQNTGVRLEPATIAELSGHPRIAGCKDSSGDLGALAETVRRVDDDFAVLVGNAGILYPALTLGATGAVLAVACLAPAACARLAQAVADQDHPRARHLQDQLADVGRLVTAGHGVPGLKAALDLAGLRGGAPRGPLRPVSREVVAILQRAMDDSGLFPEEAARPDPEPDLPL